MAKGTKKGASKRPDNCAGYKSKRKKTLRKGYTWKGAGKKGCPKPRKAKSKKKGHKKSKR